MNTMRMLKLSALILVVLGALGGPGAQTASFKAGAYPATVTGSGGIHLFYSETTAISFFCVPAPHGSLAAPSGSLMLLPNYGKCQWEGKSVSLNPNGCEWQLKTVGGIEPDKVSGTWGIVCPAGKEIDFAIPSTPVCHFLIPAQEVMLGTAYTNWTAEKEVQADFTLNELAYRLSGSCPESVGVTHTGAYIGTTYLRATHEGLATSFFVQ
jgi:hypothetical protein